MSIETPSAAAGEPRRQGRPRLVAAAFLFAFALSIVTVILTGLWVRSPQARDAPAARDAWTQGQDREPPAASGGAPESPATPPGVPPNQGQ